MLPARRKIGRSNNCRYFYLFWSTYISVCLCNMECTRVLILHAMIFLFIYIDCYLIGKEEHWIPSCFGLNLKYGKGLGLSSVCYWTNEAAISKANRKLCQFSLNVKFSQYFRFYCERIHKYLFIFFKALHYIHTVYFIYCFTNELLIKF